MFHQLILIFAKDIWMIYEKISSLITVLKNNEPWYSFFSFYFNLREGMIIFFFLETIPGKKLFKLSGP